MEVKGLVLMCYGRRCLVHENNVSKHPQTEAFMCGLKMEGITLEEEKVEELDWNTPEDGDSAHNYFNSEEDLLEYLNRKAEERRKLLE
jgi:hypothetical protein